MVKLNSGWTYGFVKDTDGKVKICEVYFEELKKKVSWNMFLPLTLIDKIKNWKQIREDLKSQKKVMKYFQWTGDKLVVVE